MLLTMGISLGGLLAGAISPQSIWAMMNQYQLLLCLPLTLLFIPERLEYFITNFKFCTLDFGFLNFEQKFFDKVNIIPNLKGLEVLGYKSQSFIINQLGFFKFLFVILILHILFSPLICMKRFKCTS